MEFDRTDDQGRKYAVLTPVFEQNATLKDEAKNAGATVTFDKSVHGYRLLEDSIPKGVDADAIFGKYATPEAREAAAAERAAFESKMQSAEKVVNSSIDESKLYYPPQKDGERKAFDEMRKNNEVDMKYSPKAGAFVHRGGDASGFERWQTPEMKAQWTKEGDERKAKQEQRVSEAGKAVEKIGKIADGKSFLAEHENGFMLPSKDRHAELHAGLKESLVKMKDGGRAKDVSDEDLTQVFKNTQSSLRTLERKKYAIELQNAQKKDPTLTSEAFQGMNDADRRKASGFKGMSNEDFSRMVALRAGMFAVRDEMISRGLITTKEQAREMQNEAGAAQAASPRQEELKRSSAKKEEPKQETAKETAKEEAPKKAAAKGGPKSEPEKEAKPAVAGAMAQALLNAGIGR